MSYIIYIKVALKQQSHCNVQTLYDITPFQMLLQDFAIFCCFFLDFVQIMYFSGNSWLKALHRNSLFVEKRQKKCQLGRKFLLLRNFIFFTLNLYCIFAFSKDKANQAKQASQMIIIIQMTVMKYISLERIDCFINVRYFLKVQKRATLLP